MIGPISESAEVSTRTSFSTCLVCAVRAVRLALSCSPPWRITRIAVTLAPIGLRYARLRKRRRSRSDKPPQIPKRSSFFSAYSRHSALTSHCVQIFLASRVDPPFSGKNASGSVCAQSASACQERAPSSSSGRRIPGIPSLTGSTNQLSGTEFRYSLTWAPLPPSSGLGHQDTTITPL